jgi:hypothetical protein
MSITQAAVVAAAVLGRPLGILLSLLVGSLFGLRRPERLGWCALTVAAFATSSGFTLALFFASACCRSAQCCSKSSSAPSPPVRGQSSRSCSPPARGSDDGRGERCEGIMAYRFRQDHSIESELRRIATRQLSIAIADVHHAGDPQRDDALHDVRRRIKKVRALCRLTRPARHTARATPGSGLRVAGRLLAPVTDARAVVDTFSRLEECYPHDLPVRLAQSVRSRLVERWMRIDRQVKTDRILDTVDLLLRQEAAGVREWELERRGFHAVGPGVRKAARRARRAMAAAAHRPTSRRYHVWRRRVKDCWLHIRLLQGRCGNQLTAQERLLEALDECLGEYHDGVLLAQVLVLESICSRDETARCLRLLRRHQRVLRQEAQRLGMDVLGGTPGQLVRQIRRLWRSAQASLEADTRASWDRAA